jgi:hypothetical protein
MNQVAQFFQNLACRLTSKIVSFDVICASKLNLTCFSVNEDMHARRSDICSMTHMEELRCFTQATSQLIEHCRLTAGMAANFDHPFGVWFPVIHCICYQQVRLDYEFSVDPRRLFGGNPTSDEKCNSETHA